MTCSLRLVVLQSGAPWPPIWARWSRWAARTLWGRPTQGISSRNIRSLCSSLEIFTFPIIHSPFLMILFSLSFLQLFNCLACIQSEFWSHFFIILLLLHCSLGRSTCNSLQMPNLLRLSCQTFSFLFLGNEEMEIRFLCWSSEFVFVYKGFLTREVLLVQELPASRRKLIWGRNIAKKYRVIQRDCHK